MLIDPYGQEIKDKIEYRDVMTFNQLTRGNYFGGRVLIPYEHYANLRRLWFGNASLERYYPLGCNKKAIDKESDEDYHYKSLLSVIADSAKCEVWIIDKNDMGYLPDQINKEVFEKIILSKEEDRPFHE